MAGTACETEVMTKAIADELIRTPEAASVVTGVPSL